MELSLLHFQTSSFLPSSFLPSVIFKGQKPKSHLQLYHHHRAKRSLWRRKSLRHLNLQQPQRSRQRSRQRSSPHHQLISLLYWSRQQPQCFLSQSSPKCLWHPQHSLLRRWRPQCYLSRCFLLWFKRSQKCQDTRRRQRLSQSHPQPSSQRPSHPCLWSQWLHQCILSRQLYLRHNNLR